MANLKSFKMPVAFHPGVTLSEKLEEMGMSVKEFAVRTAKPEKTIFAIKNGTSSVTSDMAVAFESVTKIPAHFWLNKQLSYDEYVARKKREERLCLDVEWAKAFPIKAMQNLNWIPAWESMEDLVDKLLMYFQVSSSKAWKDYYLHKELKVAFRISLTTTNEPHAVSAWLRQGEIQAMEMSAEKFNEKTLRESIPAMKALCAEHPSDYADRLQSLCAMAGVKLVYTPCLPKAPINGATRWINESPCIQMTGRHKRNDIFWFSFFHELGHILLHGKKDIFLEDIEYAERQDEKEKDANEFASRTLLSKNDEDEILRRGIFSEEDILNYAKEFNIHPGVLLGRLQHNNVIPHGKYNHLFKKVELFE